MLSKKFATRAHPAPLSPPLSQDPTLASFEGGLRQCLTAYLSSVLARHEILGSADGLERSLPILKDLDTILQGGRGGKFYFRYEEAHPLPSVNKSLSFHEALIAMQDKHGAAISTAEVLAALDEPPMGGDLGPIFRAWLIVAQINDFYTHHIPSARLSLNILPGDTDSAFFRQTVTLGMKLAQQAGLSGIILEAVENEPWTPARREFLQSLRPLGATLALDDYGAPQGYNQADTLLAFDEPPAVYPIIVKLDGQIVRAFIDKGDTTVIDRLREARLISPRATVVAEWINDAADAKVFLSKLATYGLDKEVHLVQGRTLPASPRTFLREMAQLQNSDSGPQPRID